MALFSKPKYSTVVVKKKDIPKGLWTKCPISGEIVFNKELEANLMVVPEEWLPFSDWGATADCIAFRQREL